MQRNLRNLAIALVAGTFAIAAGAQDEGKKAPKKAAAPAAASSGSGRVVVNGVVIPQSRIDAMNRELTQQGQPDTPERQNAVREELVNREVIAQAAQKRGLDKNPDVASQMEMARQAVLVRALFEDEVKKNPITDAMLQQQYEQFKSSMGTNEYKVRHILVDKEDDAKAIIAELNKGGDFAKIAKPFADAVTSMQKGQTTTAPVKTDFGYHVIRLDDIRPLQVPPFTELKDQFRQRAQQQQIQKMVMDLRGKAKIEER